MSNDLRSYAISNVMQHPRVAYQKVMTPEAQARLLDQLPLLPGFRRDYVGGFALIDWDHRLPSQNLTLRILGYYAEATLNVGRDQLGKRQAEISKLDKYPEFDVPDFGSLFADDAYECDLALDGGLGKCRLVSTWRRDIDDAEARRAASVVTASPEYKSLIAEIGKRPAHLGEVEAVSWIPPCESELPLWTLDVWYLLSFDGRVGTGKSFLVDIGKDAVITVRDFSVRTN